MSMPFFVFPSENATEGKRVNMSEVLTFWEESNKDETEFSIRFRASHANRTIPPWWFSTEEERDDAIDALDEALGKTIEIHKE